MTKPAKLEHMIQRYEHNYFYGYVVSATRAGKTWTKYFSDSPHGKTAALRAARAYKDALYRQLPWPAKVHRRSSNNTSGIIGVARTRELTRAGTWLERWVAFWRTRDRRRRKVSFSVGKYGEAKARKLAIEARRRGIEAVLGKPQPD
jgi:hypothetical protein